MTDFNITLVEEIEKYPELYDFQLPEYARKDATERAWGEISKKMKLSVNECKDKWRNIRSTLIRSLKAPSRGSKQKKPYYLKEYLSFVLPFVKPVHESQTPGNIPTPSTSERDPSTDDEEADDDNEEQTTAAAHEIKPNVNLPEENSTKDEPATTPSNSQIRGKRRRIYNFDSGMLSYPKEKIDNEPSHKQSNKNQTNINHFFLSIINEFDDMTDQEVRTFKIKTLQLIDDIKQERQSRMPAYLGESLLSTDPLGLERTLH